MKANSWRWSRRWLIEPRDVRIRLKPHAKNAKGATADPNKISTRFMGKENLQKLNANLSHEPSWSAEHGSVGLGEFSQAERCSAVRFMESVLFLSELFSVHE